MQKFDAVMKVATQKATKLTANGHHRNAGFLQAPKKSIYVQTEVKLDHCVLIELPLL